jgi:predicted metal-dependent hydrolase
MNEPSPSPTRPESEAASDPLSGLAVEFQRSRRRRRTISARLDGDRLIVQVPMGLSAAQEREWAERLGGRILAARRRRELNDDQQLMKRAHELNRRHFGGKLQFRDVRYVTNQNSRHGSCSPAQGIIRISDRLAKMPAWVRDAVLVHELAHLVEGNHSARFWKLANAYPLMERARGYLMAVGLEEDEALTP